jgi:broad specificity phosphatase PhoE
MITAWLIRHGESQANAGLPTDTPTNNPLTSRGWEQARQLVAALPHPPSLIVTSPYIRAQQTAQPTIAQYPSVPRAKWRVQEFTYLDLERCRNTTRFERRAWVEDYWSKSDPLYVDGEGAESFANLIDRVLEMRQKITQLENEFVTIFSHELFMKAVLWSCLTPTLTINARSMQQFRAFSIGLQIPNGAIVKAQFQSSEVWLSSIVTDHLKLPNRTVP